MASDPPARLQRCSRAAAVQPAGVGSVILPATAFPPGWHAKLAFDALHESHFRTWSHISTPFRTTRRRGERWRPAAGKLVSIFSTEGRWSLFRRVGLLPFYTLLEAA